MKQYQDLMREVLENGTPKGDRTGTGTISLFGHQSRYDLSKGFPLVTTKKVHLKSIIHELLWFLSGDTNVKYLQDNGVKIWDAWSREDGSLGPIYAKQWRDFGGVDQIQGVITGIAENPHSRRLIVSSWNPPELPKMSLMPCHCFFQFYVNNGKLSCQLYQRSADIFLGVPFNIASYALLTQMVAQVSGLELGDFIHTIGDAHIYENHLEQVKLQLSREPKKLPTMKLNKKVDNIFDFCYDDFTLEDYEFHPHIKGKVSV